jgi:hypothetical protein
MKILIVLMLFFFCHSFVFSDITGYSGKKQIQIESENFIIRHGHDWSQTTENQRYKMILTEEQDPFLEDNDFAYIECINKKTHAIVFHIPSTALTHLFISHDEKYIVGISNIMLYNPYQLIIMKINGEIIKKRHIASSEAKMNENEFENLKNNFPDAIKFLSNRKRIFYHDSFYYIDFLSINMPHFLGTAFDVLIGYMQENHLSNNFFSTVTNWIFWFNEENQKLVFNNNYKGELYSISILDPKNEYIEILIDENNI